MKEYIVIIIVFAALLFAAPVTFAAVHGENGLLSDSAAGDKSAVDFSGGYPQTVSLLLSENGEIVELSVTDYLVGCLFAQMPLNYHEQALKAQAIAAHTYLLRLMMDGTAISDSATVCQAYFTEEKARKHYGDEYDAYLETVRSAAEYGANRVILYEDQPIYAVYHSVSAGVTNTAYSVWGKDFPYLRSVESSWDREHPDYLCVNEMTAESVREALFDYNNNASMPLDYSGWFSELERNDFGYVISVKAGDTTLSGGDMWRMFNLRSVSFDISFGSSGVFVVETRGFGHGAGLSQYGADVLAKRGFSAEEILKHYYTEVTVN